MPGSKRASLKDLGTGAARRGAEGLKARELRNELQRIETKKALGRPLSEKDIATLRRAAQSTDASQ